MKENENEKKKKGRGSVISIVILTLALFGGMAALFYITAFLVALSNMGCSPPSQHTTTWVGTEAPVEEKLPEPPELLDELHWGMFAGYVKKAMTAELLSESVTDTGGRHCTVLSYGGARLYGYDTEAELYIDDLSGLCVINCEISGTGRSSGQALIGELTDTLLNEGYTEPEARGGALYTRCEKSETAAMLVPYIGYVMCCVWPLWAEDELPGCEGSILEDGRHPMIQGSDTTGSEF